MVDQQDTKWKHTQRCNSLSLGVLSVGNSIANDTLEEGLENTTSLLVDHSRDTLDTSTPCKTSDSWLGDTLDVVTKNLAVTLGSTLSETLATFSAYRETMLAMSAAK
jgi:hypothetical protein